MKASRDKASDKKIGDLSFQICLIVKNLFGGIQNHFNMIIILLLYINALCYFYGNKIRAVGNGTEFAYTN